MSSLIVTGGAGFIGSSVVRALNQRGFSDIIVVDHLNHPLKERNLAALSYRAFHEKKSFRELLRAGKIDPVDCCFHLGACSSTTETDEAYLADNNLQYSVELCEWALEHDVRFVYASSAATYGNGSLGYSDRDELTPQLQPLNLYGWSKQGFDLWLLSQGLLDRVAGLKYFNVYGPGEDHKGEMRSLIRKAYDVVKAKGVIRLFKSHRPGIADGEQTRDFIYVDDAVEETLYFYDHPEINGLYNCGTGEARSWNDLARALFTAMELPVNIEYIDMPESIRDKYQYHTEADLTKLRAAGYSRLFQSIEAGVEAYIQFLRSR